MKLADWRREFPIIRQKTSQNRYYTVYCCEKRKQNKSLLMLHFTQMKNMIGIPHCHIKRILYLRICLCCLPLILSQENYYVPPNIKNDGLAGNGRRLAGQFLSNYNNYTKCHFMNDAMQFQHSSTFAKTKACRNHCCTLIEIRHNKSNLASE